MGDITDRRRRKALPLPTPPILYNNYRRMTGTLRLLSSRKLGSTYRRAWSPSPHFARVPATMCFTSSLSHICITGLSPFLLFFLVCLRHHHPFLPLRQLDCSLVHYSRANAA